MSRIPLIIIVLGVLTFFPLPTIADDYPTDRDLRVAYCQGSLKADLDAAPEAWRAIGAVNPRIEQEQREKLRRATAYLFARSDGFQKNMMSVFPAISQGAADAHTQADIVRQCAPRCQEEAGGEVNQWLMCQSRCGQQLDSFGILKKLQSCDEVIRDLPF